MTDESPDSVNYMSILVDAVGIIDAERFVSYVIGKKADFELWMSGNVKDLTLQEMFDDIAIDSRKHRRPDDPFRIAEKYMRKHPRIDQSDENHMRQTI